MDVLSTNPITLPTLREIEEMSISDVPHFVQGMEEIASKAEAIAAEYLRYAEIARDRAQVATKRAENPLLPL